MSKYGLHPNGWDVNIDVKATLRSPWKSIAKGWDKFVENTKLLVGKGDRIRFWEDSWVGNSPLKESFPRLYRLSNNHNMLIQSVVSWYSHSNHSWDLNFSRNFSDRECDDLISIEFYR